MAYAAHICTTQQALWLEMIVPHTWSSWPATPPTAMGQTRHPLRTVRQIVNDLQKARDELEAVRKRRAAAAAALEGAKAGKEDSVGGSQGLGPC